MKAVNCHLLGSARCKTIGCHVIGAAILASSLITPAVAQSRFLPPVSAVVLSPSVHSGWGKQSGLRELDKAWRAQPQDQSVALAYARAVFTLGLNEGDLRWFGSAKAALAPWWQTTDLTAEAYFLRGLVKQGFHDFNAGLQDINRAIELEPGRAEFWSWRFALHLLLADMAAAQQDIDHMDRHFGKAEADIYRGIFFYRTGQPGKAAQILRRAFLSPNYQDASSQDWLAFHLGEALRVDGQPSQAIAVWGQRLKKNANSHLLRLSLADLHNQQAEFMQAKKVAMNQVDAQSMTDALLMQALIASRGLKDADEPRLANQMEARVRVQAMRQESLIERPKLIYQISYGVDITAGLALSIENWKQQKEPPDAILFVQAALALGQATSALQVVTWANQTGYTEPQLKLLLKQLQAHPSWTKNPS